MSSTSKRTTRSLATSSANKANKATASSSATVSDKRHVTNLDEELSSLLRTDLVLERDMPLAFDTGAYKETDICGTLGTRDGADDPWRYGVFVPAQAVLHAFGTDGRTLLTVVFKGERMPIHTRLPLRHELDSVCAGVGERYVTIGLASTEERESLCVLQFAAAAPRDAFVARARDPAAALDGFQLHPHEQEQSAPQRRPVTEVPTTDDEWRERRHAKPLGIGDIALADLRAFCDAHGIAYGQQHSHAMMVQLIICWIDHNLVGC